MTRTGDLYGQSLYDLALSENLTDKILSQMETVKKIFDENPDYVKLLSEPSVPKKERIQLIDDAFGDSLEEYLMSFLKILIEKDLLRQFPSCMKRFRTSYNKDKGIADAIVTSAVALSDSQSEALKKKLESISGKKIILRQKTDPSVLGGIRVEVEGKLYDGTVERRLEELRRKVDETVL
ncbi:MAG: ATP synthase F1 subunit delta [Lachnospiraceae bacterium]|nr:ATP synthase F1 subunit delta [Lachnospiraceae bacterium]